MEINIFNKIQENTYLKQDDKLVWCNLISANFIFEKDLEHFKLHYAMKTEQGVITIDDEEIHIYDKNGIEWKKDFHPSLHPHSLIETCNEDQGIVYKVVVFDGVTPVHENIVPISATYSYEKLNGIEITWSKGYDFRKDCYENEQECSNWNRCLVREEDGTEHWVEGRFYRLLLNEKQEEAAKRFESACEELTKAGLSIVVQEYGGGAIIVPKKNRIEVGYDSPESWGTDGNWFAVEEEHRLRSSIPLSNAIMCAKCCDDNSIWVDIEE